MNQRATRRPAAPLALFLLVAALVPAARAEGPARRLLYVAEPGIRNYLEYGGHGLLVFDIDDGHKFVKRIKTAGLDAAGKPDNVKGICASARTGRVYVGTTRTVTCLDLRTDAILWEKAYEGGCDRMAISPNGSTIYLPSFEGDHWHVIAADDGRVLAKIEPKSGAHNTVYGLDGKHAYLAGLKSPWLSVADTASMTVSSRVGPFAAAVRPFTVNGRQTLCFVNVNGLLGFEVGDLKTGEKMHRVEVPGYKPGPVKRHGCPSHGIGLTPDETELWVADAFNQTMHVFDATVMPPTLKTSLKVREEPGWVTFSLDGRYAYPSTGEVFETATKRVAARLADETGRPVMSEKMLEIDFEGSDPVRNGDQFGLGRVGAPR